MATVANRNGVDGTDAHIPSPRDVKLSLTDGVTAPATIAGVAQLYVDTADGDLKVKFGDGTTKVVSADT